MKSRNPNWIKDELILAYHTLKSIKGSKFSASTPEIRRLSHLLNSLCIHKAEDRLSSFRDPSGVRRRVSYLKRIEEGSEVEGREEYKAIVDKYSDNFSALQIDMQSIILKYKKHWSRPPKSPKGNNLPTKKETIASNYERDQKVVDWVLDQANGTCECCKAPAPFINKDNKPFLEVHHLLMLSEGGSDTITNAAAICPNCHRELHYGKDKDLLINNMYFDIQRLEVE